MHENRGSTFSLLADLYDHASGPLATCNQAADPALVATVSELSRLLDKGQGWKAVRQELSKR